MTAMTLAALAQDESVYSVFEKRRTVMRGGRRIYVLQVVRHGPAGAAACYQLCALFGVIDFHRGLKFRNRVPRKMHQMPGATPFLDLAAATVALGKCLNERTDHNYQPCGTGLAAITAVEILAYHQSFTPVVYRFTTTAALHAVAQIS